jgi:hypothetical protein
MTDQTTDQAVDTSADTTTPATDATTVQLQIADLILAAQVVQLAATRGAFKPEEFTQVGALYERIVGFLQASGAIVPADQAPATDTTAEAPAQTDAPATDATAPATN